jgi:hypothetical protein
MGATTNYNWNIGIKGQNPWWDEWETLWTNVDTELYKRTKDLYMQGKVIYGSELTGGDLILKSTSHVTKGKIYVGSSLYFDEARTGGIVQKIITDDAYGSFNVAQGKSLFAGSARYDQILNIGYNLKEQGGSEDPTEPSMGIQLESFYSPVAGTEYSEMIFGYTKAGGGFSVRPWQATINRNTDYVYQYFEADEVYFNTPADVQALKILSSTILLYGSVYALEYETNNLPFLTQKNAAGAGYVSLLKLNASDKLEILVNAVFDGTLEIGNQLTLTRTAAGASPFITVANANNNAIFLRGGSALYYFDFWRSTSTGALNIQGNQSGYQDIVLCPTAGKVGIGMSPKSPLAVSGLPVYANNAAAIAANKVAGDFYYKSGDPSGVCVVTTSPTDIETYGEMYANNIGQVVTITVADVYVQVPAGLTGGLNNGFTFQNARELKCLVAGIYQIHWSMSMQATAQSTEIEGAVLLNWSAPNGAQVKGTAHAEVSIGGVNRPETISGTLILALAVNDLISLGVSNHTDAADVNLQHASLTIRRIDGYVLTDGVIDAIRDAMITHGLIAAA